MTKSKAHLQSCGLDDVYFESSCATKKTCAEIATTKTSARSNRWPLKQSVLSRIYWKTYTSLNTTSATPISYILIIFFYLRLGRRNAKSGRLHSSSPPTIPELPGGSEVCWYTKDCALKYLRIRTQLTARGFLRICSAYNWKWDGGCRFPFDKRPEWRPQIPPPQRSIGVPPWGGV